MTATLATILVSLLNSILPLIGSMATGGVSNIITLLEQILPVAVNEAESLVPSIQNIIAAIQGSGTVTADQVASLAALSAQYDAAFEAAAAADGDPAPAATAS